MLSVTDYRGLIPRLIGDLVTVWLANIITFVLNNFLIKSSSEPGLKVCCSFLTVKNTMIYHGLLSQTLDIPLISLFSELSLSEVCTDNKIVYMTTLCTVIHCVSKISSPL